MAIVKLWPGRWGLVDDNDMRCNDVRGNDCHSQQRVNVFVLNVLRPRKYVAGYFARFPTLRIFTTVPA